MVLLVTTTVDGETNTQTMAQFLAENEANSTVCNIVSQLQAGMTYSPTPEVVYSVAEKAARKKSRTATFVTDWNFDGSKRVKVAINRDSGVVTVRPLRRHKTYYGQLGELAAIIATRACAKEAGVNTRAKKRRTL